MRLIIHSNSPHTNAAYGLQTRMWARKFREAGHEVIISAFSGLNSAPIVWDGFKILPGAFPADMYGSSVLPEHLRREQADMILTLMDVWALDPAPLRGLPLACWIPIDTSPLSIRDEQFLRASGGVPVAMSRHGQRMLIDAGFTEALYAPHGCDLSDSGFHVPSGEERDKAREQLGVTGKFAIGMNAANKDAFRKGFAEQFLAFARFHERHPDSALLIHAMISDRDALDLRTLRERCGLPAAAVRYVDQYAYLTGQIGQESVAAWYSALDLYTACSLGEGFGIPVVEAMASGVPVVATNASSGPELAGGQWLVSGEPLWNAIHGAWWVKPNINMIHKVYESAYKRGPAYENRKARTRQAVEPYGVDRVWEDHWKPALATLEERFRRPVTLTETGGSLVEVSVCFASRGRPDSLQRAVTGLVEKAAEPETVEILVAVDPDDHTMTGLDLPPQVRLWTAPERYGYTNLHLYLNALAAQARGVWCMWWNDDMVMVTPGWDKAIRAARPAVLWPHANHVEHANIAPAWPKAWSEAMGHVSPTTHMDTYLQRLGEALGRHDPIAVEILHDRFDVTGNHDDQTFAEGRGQLGPEGMAPGFDEAAMWRQVAEDARIIRELIEAR